jgi:hypothetical protein
MKKPNKPICEYCEKEIDTFGSYVTKPWLDVYGKLHTRYLHDENGHNFFDSCYDRFSHKIPKDAIITTKTDVSNITLTPPDYNLIIGIRHSVNRKMVCEKCSSEIIVCGKCGEQFKTGDSIFCLESNGKTHKNDHIHAYCSPILSKAIK